MRFFSSAGQHFSHRTLGTTPNIAPPSSRNRPSVTGYISIFPSFIAPPAPCTSRRLPSAPRKSHPASPQPLPLRDVQGAGGAMKLGKIEIYPVTDGRFRLDGGAMFGVVPKVLWEKCCPADEKNRIQLGLNCLLIRAHGKNILVDTGLGSKVDTRFQDRFAIERKPPLEDSLKRVGLAHEDVHMVVNTHLHFDHCVRD